MKVKFYLLFHKDVENFPEEVINNLHPRYRQTGGRGKKAGRQKSLASGILLRQVLGIYREEQLAVGEKGKLTGRDADIPAFSLSHSKVCTVLAVSEDGTKELGVDIEDRISRNRQDSFKIRQDIYRRYFPPECLNEYLSAAESEQTEVFLRHWTCLEAMLKAGGCGFTIPEEEMIAAFPEWKFTTSRVSDQVITAAAKEPVEITECRILRHEESGNERIQR